MTSSLLNAKEVAQILNVSEAQVYLIMRRGDLPVVRIGRLCRIRQEDLDQYVMNQIDKKQAGLTVTATSPVILNSKRSS